MDYEKRVQVAMREVAAAGLAESAHDLSDGGLAVALAESSFGRSGVGAAVELDSAMPAEWLLFHEGPSRILVSTDAPEEVERIAARHAVAALRIGVTVENRLAIRAGGTLLVEAETKRLRDLWEGALEKALRG